MGVERRKESRLQTNQVVTLSVLSSAAPAIAGMVMEGRVLDVSGSGVHLSISRAIPCGAPVKVAAKELLMVGEVCRCEPHGDAFDVGLQLSQTFTAFAELESLNDALREEEDQQSGSRKPVAQESEPAGS